ncbi:hypothetical protein DFJ43DRAFT_1072913 [Lentinula guzmanii]|uniref:BHLH domain-containing protein n=1 Tax=Lentinula guzmanii TaxID=2804957 RepID=A0AA38N131_9AGAR|nr:hypothetical protein DFJ43DRAFT_1072913 [Lentinula guzmanii]
MSDLLTPSESQQLHTFLSAMDYNETNDARSVANVGWAAYNNDAHGQSMPEIPHLQGREALAKATKDLMSLDAEGWNSAPVMHQYQQQQQSYNFMDHQSSQFGYVMHNNRQPDLYQQSSTFPLLSKQGSKSPHPFTHPHSSPSQSMNHGHLSQSISISPSHTTGTSQDPRNGSSMRSSFSSMGSLPTTASSSSFSIASSSRHEALGTSSLSSNSNPSVESLQQSRSADANGFNKRPLDPSSYPASNKRSRPSPPAASSLLNKTTLLSPSQKKANHIQSEQKRRANIRRGYEALCETVPALREAIRAEEEAQLASDANSNGKKPKRGRRAKLDDGTGEKIDGRAGPKSENIVLGRSRFLYDYEDSLP